MKRSPIGAAFVLTVTLNVGLCAQTDELRLVPPYAVPAAGTFWSLQKLDSEPPMPYDPFPDLPVYSLGDGIFLVDDSSVDYAALRIQAAGAALVTAGIEAAQTTQSWQSGVGFGCGLWLSLGASNDVALLSLHNTREGQIYTVWSLEGDLSQTDWVVETNVTGASGDVTDTTIPMGQRPNLFFRASEDRDYTTNAVFLGLNFTNSQQLVPDSMGAVGPSHFVELLNGGLTNASIAVYDKSGALISQSSPTNFFSVQGPDGTNYPTGSLADQRILYDSHSQRWVASSLQDSAGVVILAISNDDSPTNLVSGWTKHLIQFENGNAIDYPTLGVDDNGIYLSIMRLGRPYIQHTIVAIKKPEIYDGTILATQIEVTNDLNSWTIQPTVNLDAVETNDPAWFVAKGSPDFGTDYQGGALFYRRLQWQGTNAAWADTNWMEISGSGSGYQDYYELGGTNFNSIPLGTGIVAPQAGGTNGINLFSAGSRLMMATIRNGYLWTCHAVGLSGTNGTYAGDASGTNVDRSAIQWFKLQIEPDEAGLTMSEYGRVFDSAATNPWWYHYPSLAVNCAGDMVLGFSGSSLTNYIGAFYTWRLAGGSTPERPLLIQAGTTNYNLPLERWGDYSATTCDPADDWSFWTVQEYATPLLGRQGNIMGRWGTVIAKIRPNP